MPTAPALPGRLCAMLSAIVPTALPAALPAVLLAALPAAWPGPAAAQRPGGPPSFAPGDTEGLVVAPNPHIRHAWKRRVAWKTSHQPPRAGTRAVPPHSPAERAAMTATLDALLAPLKATPTGRDGEGFWVQDSRTLDYTDPAALPDRLPAARLPLVFETGLFPFTHEDIESQGQWRLSVPGETESATFVFNRLPESVGQPALLNAPPAGTRAAEPWYLQPRVTGTWQGLPVYEQQMLVVARAGRDPWAPVPLARALEAALPLLAGDRKRAEDRLAAQRRKRDEVMSPEWERTRREQFERQYGELRTTRPSNHAARLRSLDHEIEVLRQQAQADADPQPDARGAWYWNPVQAHDEATRRLAALTAATADEPACVAELPAAATEGRYQFKARLLTRAEAADCRALVRTNWAYFDLTLARSTPQILVLRDFGRCARLVGNELAGPAVTRWDVPPHGCVQHARMWREADWAALAATVAR